MHSPGSENAVRLRLNNKNRTALVYRSLMNGVAYGQAIDPVNMMYSFTGFGLSMASFDVSMYQ